MPVERNTEREFGVFNILAKRFMDLDRIGFWEEEYLTDSMQIPAIGLYSEEECQRWLIHQQNRQDFEVINCKQPKYLTDFAMRVLIKQRSEKAKASNLRYQQSQTPQTIKSVDKAKINSSKQSYFDSLTSWRKKLNAQSTQVSGQYGKVLSEQPKMSDFGLENSNFTKEEKATLSSEFRVVTD